MNVPGVGLSMCSSGSAHKSHMRGDGCRLLKGAITCCSVMFDYFNSRLNKMYGSIGYVMEICTSSEAVYRSYRFDCLKSINAVID